LDLIFIYLFGLRISNGNLRLLKHISVADKYVQSTFHFHHPSEEKIKGKSFDMVDHLVHKNAEGKLAVVAVLMKKGQANPMMKTLWEHLPKVEGKEEIPANVTDRSVGTFARSARILHLHRFPYHATLFGRCQVARAKNSGGNFLRSDRPVRVFL